MSCDMRRAISLIIGLVQIEALYEDDFERRLQSAENC